MRLRMLLAHRGRRDRAIASRFWRWLLLRKSAALSRALAMPSTRPSSSPGLSAQDQPVPGAISRALHPPACVRSRLSMYRRIPGDRRICCERGDLSSERTESLRLEERFGNPRQSGSLRPAFQETLLYVPCLDPLDERAGKTLRLTGSPLPDRSQTGGNSPVTSRHSV